MSDDSEKKFILGKSIGDRIVLGLISLTLLAGVAAPILYFMTQRLPQSTRKVVDLLFWGGILSPFLVLPWFGLLWAITPCPRVESFLRRVVPEILKVSFIWFSFALISSLLKHWMAKG